MGLSRTTKAEMLSFRDVILDLGWDGLNSTRCITRQITAYGLKKCALN